MDAEKLRIGEAGIYIEGYPDAVRLIVLEGPKARQIAHYALHRSDLEFAKECLEAISHSTSGVIREALWRCAVIHFLKCFKGGSARSTALDAKVVLKGDTQALEIFQFFDQLRDKHFVHDENSWSESVPCAAVNGGGKPYKIERIFGLSRHAQTLIQANYSNLDLLIKKSLEWLAEKFGALCDSVTTELEGEPHESLLKRDQVQLTAPQLAEIGVRRKGF